MFGIPEKEIKQTLANVDASLLDAKRVMAQAEGVGVHLIRLLAVLTEIAGDVRKVSQDFSARMTERTK